MDSREKKRTGKTAAYFHKVSTLWISKSWVGCKANQGVAGLYDVVAANVTSHAHRFKTPLSYVSSDAKEPETQNMADLVISHGADPKPVLDTTHEDQIVRPYSKSVYPILRDGTMPGALDKEEDPGDIFPESSKRPAIPEKFTLQPPMAHMKYEGLHPVGLPRQQLNTFLAKRQGMLDKGRIFPYLRLLTHFKPFRCRIRTWLISEMCRRSQKPVLTLLSFGLFRYSFPVF
ncbi:hypothetical protein BO83DRAFT_430736 [Aspergillus eucalypticola CBS 122712]|uniref:Uncharacterized protein n=1 Tax=Aspergillus eucalypticola (strain CBS 122712 / IBT 29274) TaxID=1448314 RepID=A0A317UWG6_ASPEC|nr:uncharacterized protein BO83DRAFT_430736 [Aspergillus eucalypticola CBS 122712]PWY64832.1 hypothetical protein BO83DRAFT_430736 [Aspergillus eucalypticola CBS 122712]